MLPSKLLLLKTITSNICKPCVRNLRNPGIDKRLKIVSSPAENLEEVDDLDDLESDFMKVHKSQKQHMREFEAMREQEKFHIVRQKYFKQKLPNFLTWHDKEQIRYLHRTDSEEWTIEKLSEGFPALPDVIAKIVKSNWNKKTQNKISNHDHHVQENWKLFKEEKIPDLPDELKEHLRKFTTRNLIFTPFSIPHVDDKNIARIKPKLACTEFSGIISDYERLKSKNASQSENCNENNFVKCATKRTTKFKKDDNDILSTVQQNKQPGDTYYECKDKRKMGNPVTLDILKTKVENKLSAGKKVSEDDRLLVSQLENSNLHSKPIELKSEEVKNVSLKKFSEVSCDTDKERKDVSHLIYPEKITIPPNLRKRGYTYKLNDCYYDDDGTFLYRVPGMIN